MLRRSIIALSKQSGRTVVRDPRKKRVPAVIQQQESTPDVQQGQPLGRPLPFQPTQQNQQAVGSTLGSYVLMGAGVALGFSLIGAIFGG